MHQQLPLADLGAEQEATQKLSHVAKTLPSQGGERLAQQVRKRREGEPISKSLLFQRCIVDYVTGCWNCTMAVAKSGYCYMRLPRTRKLVGVHRLSWELHNGPIPAGMLVCHRCDNKVCCNPEHLFTGSHRDNTHDCLAKGRCKKSKLFTQQQIQEIKESNKPTMELAEFYKVSRQTIRRVKVGRKSRIRCPNNETKTQIQEGRRS